MTNEDISLADTIENAVAEYIGSTSGGVMTNFVFVANFMDDDGGNSTAVVSPDNASVSSTIGLAHYAVNFYNEMQRRDVLEHIYCQSEDEDE